MGGFSVFLLSPYENEEREQIRVDLVLWVEHMPCGRLRLRLLGVVPTVKQSQKYSQIYIQFPK